MTEQIPYEILGLAVILAVISFLLPLSTRLKLPYSILLAAVGVALGLLGLIAGDVRVLGALGDLIGRLVALQIPAETFLTIFLPLLLFSGGLAIDVRGLLDSFAPVLVLAVIAVVVCMLAVGYALNAIFAVPLIYCLLLGAVVSATDPSAVVAVFRDLGAPRRLSILIEGESLFNDAAAIALFSLLLGILAGQQEADILDASATILIGFAGGIATGYVMGRAASLLFDLMRDLAAAKTTLTVALAYLSYVVGNAYLEVSGVVAVVTAALTLGAYGRTRVPGDSWNALTGIWEQLGFWAASLILFLAALQVPALVLAPDVRELAMLLVLIVAALAARALVVFLLLPALRFIGLGERISLAHKTVILWGGLRGAVTLALGLAVMEHPAVDGEVSRVVVVLATGFVFFTLFVQGISLRPLLHLLGLDRLSVTEQVLRDRAMALSRRQVRERVVEVAEEYEFDPSLVERIPGPAIGPAGDPGAERESEEPGADGPLPPERLSEQDRLIIGLVTLANREEELFLYHLQERTISRRMASVGAVRAMRLADTAKSEGVDGYERVAGEGLALMWSFRLALAAHRRLGWERPLAGQLAERFERLLVSQLIVRELRQFNNRAVAPLLGKNTATRLGRVLRRRHDSLRQALSALELQYPSYAEALRLRFLGRSALRFEERDYHTMLRESLVSREVFNDLTSDLKRRRELFDRRPPLDLGFRLTEMIGRVPLFEDMTPEQIAAVARLLRPRLVMPGERIVTAGERADAMFFIAAGAVEVEVAPKPVRLETGDFFGELGLLTRRPRNATVRAVGYCHLLVLEARDFRQLLRSFPRLRSAIQSIAEQRLGAA